jgi:hypothetical protein
MTANADDFDTAIQEGTLPSARHWSTASFPRMRSFTQSDAVFGDVAATNNGWLGGLFSGNFGISSGHSTVYIGDVSIRDSGGTLNTSEGGWGL